MAKFGEGGELLKCSFCGKSQKQVKKLIAGPGVYICDECIDLCNEIIDEELASPAELGFEELPKPNEINEFLDDSAHCINRSIFSTQSGTDENRLATPPCEYAIKDRAD